MVDYVANTGVTRLEGTNQQVIAGSAPSYFYNLLFNNSSGLENAIDLTSSITVENQIDFTEGIINTIDTNGEFVLQNGGTTINESDASFVDGFITKEGTNAFEFPIGDVSFFRPAAISGPNSTAASFSAKYFLEDPDTNYPRANKRGIITLVDDSEY